MCDFILFLHFHVCGFQWVCRGTEQYSNGNSETIRCVWAFGFVFYLFELATETIPSNENTLL